MIPACYFKILKEKTILLLGQAGEIEVLGSLESFEQITKLLIETKMGINALLKLLVPNKYMEFLYYYFQRFGADSRKYIVNEYIMNLSDEELETGKVKKDSIRRILDRYLDLMESYDLIRTEILPFTSPGQTKIYIAPDCTDEQLEKAFRKYKGYEEGYVERMKLKMTYHHDSDKDKIALEREKLAYQREKIEKGDIKEKESDTLNIVKKAVERKIKKTVEKDIEALTTEKYHCCGIKFVTEKELEEHWRKKKMRDIKTGEYLCNNCYKSWAECEEHNCEKNYYTEKERIKTELEALSKQREMDKGRLIA